MSFLSAAFLVALPLAAAPLLLHLFDRRRNVVIEWGAMQFLQEAAVRRTSARRLMQRLLLLLRVLAIACLVFALARPLAPGRWFGRGEHVETIIVIDNSMSMRRRLDEATLFDTAKRKAAELMSGLPPGGYVRVLLSAPYPQWETPAAVRVDANSTTALVRQVASLQPTLGGGDLLAAIVTAVQAGREPVVTGRRIVVFTDGQQADWKPGDAAAWQRLRDALQAAPVPVRLQVESPESATVPESNLAVTRLHVRRSLVGVNQPCTITAAVQNCGAAASGACTARWMVHSDQLSSEQVPALDGGAVQELVCRQAFAKAGVYAISCEVDADDALTADNRETVVVEVVDQIPILVIESAPHQDEFQQDAFFVQSALGWTAGERIDPQGVFVPTLVSPEELGSIELSGYRAIVFPNFAALDDDRLRRMYDYVHDGGGLWLALGARTDIERFNHSLFADAEGLAPLALDRIVDEPTEGPQRTRIDPLGTSHAAAAALSDHQRLDTAQAAILRRFRFAPAAPGRAVSVLLGLTNGEPFAVEQFTGRGRVIVQAAPLRLQWSELAQSQAFVVLVHDWLAYLVQPQATQHNLSPGDPIVLRVTDDTVRAATLETPQGDAIELTAEPAGNGWEFRSSRTALPGDYALEMGLAGDRIPFRVQRPPDESNLASWTAADRTRVAELKALEPQSAEGVSLAEQTSDPLWPLLWFVLLAVIAAELVLSGVITRQRFGVAAVPERVERVPEPMPGFRAVVAPRSRTSAEQTVSLNQP